MTFEAEQKGAQIAISNAISQVLAALGEDTARPGLRDTPLRVAKSLMDLTGGQRLSPKDVVGKGIFPCQSSGMVLQKDIEFFSICEHHMLPFFGKAHIAYLPNGHIIGLSKIGRIVDIYSKRLQVQETLTHQIAKALTELLKPRGVAVYLEASHFCMMMRGVKKQGSVTTTTEFTGAFDSDHQLRSHFIEMLKK